jgi:uncharacterized protein
MLSAIEDGNQDEVIRLLDAHSEALQMMTPFGTWLHVAASNGQLAIVKELVRRGIDVNARGGIAKGNALHRAATDGHYEAVKYLLEAGSEMDISEPERNPLFGAIINEHVQIGKLLIERGIDTKVSYTGDLMTNMDALAFAKERGAKGFVELLESIR